MHRIARFGLSSSSAWSHPRSPKTSSSAITAMTGTVRRLASAPMKAFVTLDGINSAGGVLGKQVVITADTQGGPRNR